ncbi:hypothetical protein FRB94_011432 [Tulasnella sp. JGI-2019a]|nr:hypothetical protein FRB93_003249 [Tulasnella sp. JGI-2019a]KAG8992591.1 hypothetical protein FRB94_011432 [Tulasnella sp. JGI-2019a]KAG9033164.1 hypothetical protein FRB95_000506 [Tulasnella sp. JGI-2019a]
MDVNLEDLTNLEQAFYDKGYKDGHDHGRIHGLIEGRALGREKGYEIWEEVGFYQGFALFWSAILHARTEDKQSRTLRNITQLIELIAQYPTQNPSHLTHPPPNINAQGEHSLGPTMDTLMDDVSSVAVPPLDMTRIRTKYRMICATLGVKPRLAPAPTPGPPTMNALGVDAVAVAAEAAEIQMQYEDEDEHPNNRAKSKQANSIWRINQSNTGDF